MSVPPLRRIELRDLVEERIEVNVRDARIEEAVEAFDEAEDLDLELVGAHDGAVDGGVERGRVAARGEDADAFHDWLISRLPVAGCRLFRGAFAGIRAILRHRRSFRAFPSAPRWKAARLLRA